MTQPTVTTIVINWKLKEATERCLQSLAQLKYPTRIVVVDNGSNDGSLEYLKTKFPEIDLIGLPSNIGFGAACNHVIARLLRESTSNYFFLLNNDAVIEARALTELVKAAEKHPEAGIFGPKIFCSDNPARLWYAGARRRRGVLAATDTGRGQIDHGQFDARQQVDYIFGAAMFIRRSVFERIQLFDERFFLYLEDLDFCLRAQQAGFSLRFVPAAMIWHIGSASTRQFTALRRYHQVRSTLVFLHKHTQTIQLPLVITFWSLVTLRTLAYDFLTGNLTMIHAHFAALRDGLSEMLRPAGGLSQRQRFPAAD
jgi:GT2 family glycosyltransferase